MILSNKYKLLDQISQGTFGIVYRGENIRTRELVAIKFEHRSNNTNMLKNEAKVYQYLEKQTGFPHLKWYGKYNDYNYMVIDLLGSSLHQIISQKKVFSLKSTFNLGRQMIQLVEILHSHSLIHRDIKPNNFLFGLGTHTKKLFLVDFGMTKRYEFDGKHIPQKPIHTLIGSPNFVSLNIHNSIEPSRRDDLISIVYVMIYLCRGSLDWFETNIDTMISLKTQLTNNTELPTPIKKLLDYTESLDFEQTPNYKYLLDLLV